jgi:PAP2 superfamily
MGNRQIGRTASALALGILVVAPVSGPAVAGTQSGHGASTPTTDAVIAWNANAGDAAIAACLSPADNPLHESRMYAMTHIAIHDALNAIDRRFQPYAFHGQARRGASVDAAVAAAAHGVLVPVLEQLTPPFGPECIDAGVASVEADYVAAIAAIPAGPARSRGIAIGEDAADAIVALRASDGADTTLLVFDYPQGSAPGEYRFTPDRPFAFAPGWADVTPFVLDDAAQFRPGPPFPVASKKYAADVNEVKALGGDGQITPSTRTPEQTQIAYFWLESSPLGWNRIARTVATSQQLDVWQNARLFGLLNMALADGYIGSFDTKYQYDYWRPVTAIREAATDGNPRTTADPTWTPLVTTPPIPDYDSAHAVEGAAAAAVLARVLGNRVSFATCSLTLPDAGCESPTPVLRHFDSFSQAAAENGASRIYVGFHFRDAVDAGMKHGDRIGTAAVKNFMLPI